MGRLLRLTTLTVDLPEEVEDRLERLAVRTRRDRSTIVGDAIADYVERELAIIDGINEALEEVHAGRVVPHDEVMDEVRALLVTAELERQ
jgi:predicted transcriptional regulator